MAVTHDGIPVRGWTFPGSTGDQKIIRRVKDDLGGWNLRRVAWVADRGFASAAYRAYLARGAGRYIHAEKLRDASREAAAALARTGRYRSHAGSPACRNTTLLRHVHVPAAYRPASADRVLAGNTPSACTNASGRSGTADRNRLRIVPRESRLTPPSACPVPGGS